MSGLYRAAGEIDIATAGGFRDGLYEAVDGSRWARVVVDCSAVEFMDSSAFHALVAATEYAARRGRTLVIRGARELHEELLRICDFDGDLNIEAVNSPVNAP